MSSSSLSSLTNTNILTNFEEKRLISALTMLNRSSILEQNVARYALLLINKFFSQSIWNIVPQFYTLSGKIPDVVLETYLHREQKQRTRIFAARVYVEFKSELNKKDAIIQLVESINREYLGDIYSRGFLMGIKGSQWTIMDYHFVNITKDKVELLYQNFYDDKGNEALTVKRPIPSRQYKDHDFMDINSPEDSLDLLNALQWIGKVNKGKDLTYTKNEAKPIPVSLTKSTLNSLNNQPKDSISDMEEEFAHLIPLIRGEFTGLVDTMDTDD